jgi:hypothetical protein
MPIDEAESTKTSASIVDMSVYSRPAGDVPGEAQESSPSINSNNAKPVRVRIDTDPPIIHVTINVSREAERSLIQQFNEQFGSRR